MAGLRYNNPHFITLFVKASDGEDLFFEVFKGPRIQCVGRGVKIHWLCRDKVVSPSTIYGISHIELDFKGDGTTEVIMADDLEWAQDATASKYVKAKDRISPSIKDKFNGDISKGDLIAVGTGMPEIRIGIFNKVSPAGTVFYRDTITQEEVRIPSSLKHSDNSYPNILKISDDMKTRIMLMKLSKE